MTTHSLSLFISYARTDSSFVDRLEADLRAHDFHTWVDRRKLEGGQDWLDTLQDAIVQCDTLLVVLSPEAVISRYVKMEYRYAQHLGKQVIPLEYKPFPKVPIDLNGIQWINFTEERYEQGLGNLLITLNPIRPNAPLAQHQEKRQQTPVPQIDVLLTLPQFDTDQTQLAAPQPTPPHPHPDLEELYRAGILAQVEGNFERTAILWQQILEQNPQFQHGTLARQLEKLLQELHPIRAQRLRDLARNAQQAGAWGQEIGAWQALLKLEPQDKEAQERIPIAEDNQKYAWMYESASQFIKDGMLPAARTQLDILWQEHPEYGDPAGLAEQASLVTVKLRQAASRGTYWYQTSSGRARKKEILLTITSQDLQGTITAHISLGYTNTQYFCSGTIKNNRHIILKGKHEQAPQEITLEGHIEQTGRGEGTILITTGETTINTGNWLIDGL